LRNEIQGLVEELQTKIATEFRNKNRYDKDLIVEVGKLVKSRFLVITAIKNV